MSINNICPVPIHQIPIEEFKKLSVSPFFKWPLNNKNIFYRRLLISWLVLFAINIFISLGSVQLKADIPKLLVVSALIASFLPLLLLIRQWISWNYILSRLLAEKIEYEESSWFDGQVWEKPINWRQRDILIAQHEVKPIVHNISGPLLVNISLVSLGSWIYLYTN